MGKRLRGDSTKTGVVFSKHHACFDKVGKTRLELATTRPPDVYANQLRYFPNPISVNRLADSVKSTAKVVQILDNAKIKVLFYFFLWMKNA